MMQYQKIGAWIALALLVTAGLAPATAADNAATKAAADAAPATTVAAGEAVFARVDGGVISVALYDAELASAFRAKFYHGKPPEAQLAQLRREVGDSLIERVLLLAEGKRRGIAPDAEKTRAALAEFEALNRDNPRLQQERAQWLPLLTQDLEAQNVLERLEAVVRETPAPHAEALREYYAAHPDSFTEPERLRLSLILLKLDPGVPQAERAKALEEAKALHQQLAAGADFAALARQRSGDVTAPKGGDMGYLHRGMLPEALHGQIDQLTPGTLSEPILLLEGAAIFRLEERLPARLRNLEESKERVAKLWQTERAKWQWTELKASLRKAAVIEVVDPSRYPDVAAINK